MKTIYSDAILCFFFFFFFAKHRKNKRAQQWLFCFGFQESWELNLMLFSVFQSAQILKYLLLLFLSFFKTVFVSPLFFFISTIIHSRIHVCFYRSPQVCLQVFNKYFLLPPSLIALDGRRWLQATPNWAFAYNPWALLSLFCFGLVFYCDLF